MVGCDLARGCAAVLAPAAALGAQGPRRPGPDAGHRFRRCGPIWLTFAAGHARAAAGNRPQDWWALAWLRGTEIATDAVWAGSPALTRPGAKAALRLAGVAHPAIALGAVPPPKSSPPEL